MKPIPYGRQTITQADIDAVVKILESDYLTQGPAIFDFERAFSEYIGCKYSVAVANGTAALHLCALATGLKPGDKVITTPITFAASANCVRYCGAEVIFADIDPKSYLLDIHSVRRLLESAPKGTFKGIIPVDFAGRAVNLEEYRMLADEFGCWIIEDACHAPGGYFVDSSGKKQHCGNGNFSELAIFSFHPVKHIACGEGGMITTNDEILYNKLLMLRTHGISKSQNDFVNSKSLAYGSALSADVQDGYPGWYMEMQDLGYNYRLTDFQAALGSSQLKRAAEGMARRKQIASSYSNAFASKPYIKGHSGEVEGHAYHLYVVEADNRAGLYSYLRTNGIYAQVHYIPVHLMPYYSELGWRQGDFPNAERYYATCLSLPMFPGLTDQELGFVIDKVDQFYQSV